MGLGERDAQPTGGRMKMEVVPVFAVATLVTVASLGADPVKLNPASMRRVGQVDARFQSYNVEMVEVTGGRFWAAYRSEAAGRKRGRRSSRFQASTPTPSACGHRSIS